MYIKKKYYKGLKENSFSFSQTSYNKNDCVQYFDKNIICFNYLSTLIQKGPSRRSWKANLTIWI